MNFFDTAGEEKYHAVTACHYRNAKGAIIVYDVTNRESFEHVERWLNDAKQLASQDCAVLILANKTDVDGYNGERSTTRVVTTEEGVAFARENQVAFFEVSAFRNENVSEAMHVLTQRVYEQYLI